MQHHLDKFLSLFLIVGVTCQVVAHFNRHTNIELAETLSTAGLILSGIFVVGMFGLTLWQRGVRYGEAKAKAEIAMQKVVEKVDPSLISTEKKRS